MRWGQRTLQQAVLVASGALCRAGAHHSLTAAARAPLPLGEGRVRANQ